MAPTQYTFRLISFGSVTEFSTVCTFAQAEAKALKISGGLPAGMFIQFRRGL